MNSRRGWRKGITRIDPSRIRRVQGLCMGAEKRQPTYFEGRVYAAVGEITSGKVVTYQSLAHHLRCRSAQAVGQALKRNPFAPQVPCHRVIRVDGSLRNAACLRVRVCDLIQGGDSSVWSASGAGRIDGWQKACWEYARSIMRFLLFLLLCSTIHAY